MDRVKKIEQFNAICSVDLERGELLSRCIVLQRSWEAEAILTMDVATFKITKAECEIHIKTAPRRDLYETLLELEGCSGYIEGKRALNQLRAKPNGELMRYLFTQCINGVIQAETYVYRQRGFESPDHYNKYWDKLEENGCRMYSNIAPDDLPWMDYAAPLTRTKNLFNRFKRVNIVMEGEEAVVSASFSDSYHELQVALNLTADGFMVANCIVDFVRAPGEACFGNGVHADGLVGQSLLTMDKRLLIDIFGGSQGCYHVVDIMLDVHRLVGELARKE